MVVVTPRTIVSQGARSPCVWRPGLLPNLSLRIPRLGGELGAEAQGTIPASVFLRWRVWSPGSEEGA